jgi:hypothetical protein
MNRSAFPVPIAVTEAEPGVIQDAPDRFFVRQSRQAEDLRFNTGADRAAIAVEGNTTGWFLSMCDRTPLTQH